ncbi:dynein regulatory complex subunit 3 isoform X2 [Melanotaenia boesemani]|uniref:dynein regulatory complex subunit 3 isoform X2 n=1 Tax=Melanotaenia boesemani TaxID=1250792 RepID=UPI001C03E747|nr:dynein regulatory complex subunit 3 isoform X2 [Melanotaenia boesemani]
MDMPPTCINEELLQNAVSIENQVKEEYALSFPKTEKIHYSEVLDLHLDFKYILKIDLLNDFTSLVKLDLKNNLIKEIQGLDSLINLKCLNLSFNRIKKIEGLDSLRKLELLNLSNNRISLIENMDTLENLSLFFIANNFISQLDNVHYLKRFKKLLRIYMIGNPVTKEENYTLFIAAYFPNLIWLDDILIDQEIREEAFIKNQYTLEKSKLEEQQKQEADEAHRSQEAELKLHKDAYVEFLNGSCLFNSMFKDDPEAEILRCTPGVAPLLQTFEDQLMELCTQLFNIGLAEHTRRETELNSFFSNQNEAETHYKNKALQRTEELELLADPDTLKLKINHCNDEITQFCNSLLTLEFELDNKLEEEIKKLDATVTDMVGNFSETALGIFAQCRDLEDDYFQKVREIAVATLEKVAKENQEEEMPEDVMMLFTDKNTVMDALATGHDNHLKIINDRENQLVTRVNAWRVALIRGIREEALQWNHMHVSDIYRYADHLRKQLEKHYQ